MQNVYHLFHSAPIRKSSGKGCVGVPLPRCKSLPRLGYTQLNLPVFLSRRAGIRLQTTLPGSVGKLLTPKSYGVGFAEHWLISGSDPSTRPFELSVRPPLTIFSFLHGSIYYGSPGILLWYYDRTNVILDCVRVRPYRSLSLH